MPNKKNNPTIVLEYKSLVVVGVKGMLEQTLDEARIALKDERNFEIAQVKKEAGRDFLAIFAPNYPTMDITIDQEGSQEAAIVGYSLDKPVLLKTVKMIQERLNFSLDRTVNAEFNTTLERELEIEKMSYEMCATIAQSIGKPIEAVFASVRYANFLSRYCQVPLESAQRRATSRVKLI